MADYNERYVTSLGVAIYPHLTSPDTKFNAEGEYKCKLRLSPDAAILTSKGKKVGTVQDFIEAQMEASMERAKKENKGKLKTADAPYEIDEDTGDYLVNFKLKAQVTPKKSEPFTQKVALFDAKGTAIKPTSVGGGSKLKVSFEVIPFYTKLIGAGVSLRMKAVQIVDLVESASGASADSYGFGEEEGYEGDPNGFSAAEAEEDEGYDDYPEAGGDDESEGADF